MALLQRCGQVLPRRTKAAIAHKHDLIPGLRCCGQIRDEFIVVRVHVQSIAQGRKTVVEFCGNLRGPVYAHEIGIFERRRKRIVVNAQLHRVRSRLQRDDDALPGKPFSQSGNRPPDGRGVVGEIVINGNVCNRRRFLQPSFDAFEPGQGLYRLLQGNAGGFRCRDRRQRIFEIVTAAKQPVSFSAAAATSGYTDLAFRRVQERCLPVRVPL